jgi:hypothetical protein
MGYMEICWKRIKRINMRNLFLIIVVPFLYCCGTKGQQADNISLEETVSLVQKIESEMQKHYKHLDKNGIFEDPLGRINYFFKVVKTVAPVFLSDTRSYKIGLLSLLTDSSFHKSEYTDLDIIYILYNLSIDDYVDVLDCALVLLKQNHIDQDIFNCFIFQDFNVSNSVAKNYRNEKLQVFLDEMLQDKELISRMGLQSESFQQAILDLKSGITWHGVDNSSGLKALSKIQYPILDTLK